MNSETVADVIAEMRERAEAMEILGTTRGVKLTIREFAARIEAALERDRTSRRSIKIPIEVVPKLVGNAAATRKALEEIRVEAMSDYEPDADYLIEKCNAALSSPPRQCDIGTAEEQSVRMSEFCREQYKKTDGVALCSGCRFHNIEGLDCQFAWAQMPYEAEEGGAGNGVQSAS